MLYTISCHIKVYIKTKIDADNRDEALNKINRVIGDGLIFDAFIKDKDTDELVNIREKNMEVIPSKHVVFFY